MRNRLRQYVVNNAIYTEKKREKIILYYLVFLTTKRVLMELPQTKQRKEGIGYGRGRC